MFNESSFPQKKELLSSWPSLKRFLLVLGGVLMVLYLNFYIVHFFADDLFFIQRDEGTLLSTLIDRYQHRTSRVFIEALLFYFAHHLLLWKIVNSLVMIGFAFFLALYTTAKRKAFHAYLAILFFFAIPLKVLQTSGWMTSSINYLWPMTAALIGFFPIFNWYRNRRRASTEIQLLCNGFLILACNSEYEALFILLLMIGLLSYSYVKEGKIPRVVLLPALISYGSLLFAFHTPGNTVRWLQEAHANFKNFQQVSLIHKLDLGFSSTCYEFFFNTNLLTLFFFSLILFSVIRNHVSHFARFAAFMPTIILLGSVLRSLLIHQKTQSMTARTLSSVDTQLFLHDEILFALLFVSTLWALLHSVRSLRTGFFLCFIFLTGFTLRIVIGFTPMIWSGDFRTFFIFYVCILYLSLMIYQELFHVPVTKYLVLFFNLACILSFIELI
ncbi:DUF6056 family protein [Enterococcus devriesei]|uniref:DUF6056 family protein n=1 Tax=Enterococcus devriesei TaxID=319970 RepID=UPI0028E52E9B|nr:DUF6056 family protein [Enterococcus devriesei]